MCKMMSCVLMPGPRVAAAGCLHMCSNGDTAFQHSTAGEGLVGAYNDRPPRDGKYHHTQRQRGYS